MTSLVATDATHTTCPYCGVGCGVKAKADAAVSGDAEHPANHGRLCVKGSALHETLGMSQRLLTPSVAGKETSWDGALDYVAEGFRRIREQHGADAIAMYVSGQLLTEDYYVANKFMKGFVGTANIDTNSRLCMASAVAAYKRAFGADVVPGCYEDLDCADLLVLAGSNAAWTHPILFQRMQQNKKNNPQCKVVVIDPRRTASCDLADLHLPIKPGSDAFLFNGLLVWLAAQDALDKNYIKAHTENFSETLQAALEQVPSIAAVAEYCAVSEQDILTFYQWFSATKKAVTFYSQGINQSSSGVDKCNAVINCHLASGKIGYAGAGPFSVTGQPNAMGGREVGGLANQLAAHMDFHHPGAIDRVSRFWQAQNMASKPGLKAVDMFDAVADGRIRAIWIVATNPMVSMPENRRLQKALEQCELVVVSDCVSGNDTMQYADVLLPAVAWGEKDGTVTNSERCISRQRAFLPTPGQAKPDWWIISEVARRMGYRRAFSYRSACDIFNEHAALSAFENQGTRSFDLCGLMQLEKQQYDELQPIQWPVNKTTPDGSKRLFSEGYFYTDSGKAQFIPVAAHMPVNRVDRHTPFLLNTGRIRDQWHTMTRTARAQRLLQHISEPFCEINPQDAHRLGIAQGDIVTLNNRHGELMLKAVLTDSQQQGQLFAPIHWNDSFAAAASVDALASSVVDPLSGQPEFKQLPVAVRKKPIQCRGLLLSATPLALDRNDYWVMLPCGDSYLYFFASENMLANCAERLLADYTTEQQAMVYQDMHGGEWRLLAMQDDRPHLLLHLKKDGDLPDHSRLIELFTQQAKTQQQQLELLAGQSCKPQPPQGSIVCACFQVGELAIKRAVADGCVTLDQLGDTLKCGSNCGSCVPELKQLLAG